MTRPAHEMEISVVINGQEVVRRVPVRRNLVDFLRHDIGLTGTHVGCEHGFCGACSVLVEGQVVRGCLMLAVQADGLTVDTIEGIARRPESKALCDAFIEHNALQCGFCTPAMLLTAINLLKTTPNPDRTRIRESISGNFCRCTGYQAIVDAIEQAAANERSTSHT